MAGAGTPVRGKPPTVCSEHCRDLEGFGHRDERGISEIHRQALVPIHEGCRALETADGEAEDRNASRREKPNRSAGRGPSAKREMTRFRYDGFSGDATVDDLGPHRGTRAVPLVPRVEHGDERPGVEQHVAGGGHG